MLFSKTNRYCFVLAGIILTSLLWSLHFSDNSVFAYTASITTNNSISFDISPSGDGTSIHSESINVQSDCRAGYNLTIATPEGSSLYKYENNTQAGTASFTAVDGTSALNSSNNTNKWGYTLTNNPTSSTIFSPLSSTASILKTSSQTASPSADINDTFDINYGAQVSNSVDAGNYQMANQGAIVYYLTMDTTCTQYTVAFNANGGTGTMDNQGIEAGEPTKLTSADSLTAPQDASYTDAGNNTITGTADKLWTFWGWNTQIDGSGDWYKDREAVEDLAGVGSTITLYAQWKQATLADLTTGTQIGTEKVINHNEMQDMSPETCWNSTAYSTDTSSDAHNPYDPSTNPNGYHTITLIDYRGKVTTGESPEQPESYTVSKLPDTLCWMTKDLNLGRESGGANNDGTVTLTSDDTDLADNTTFTLPASPTTYTTGSTGYRTPQILINHTVTSYTVNSISYSPTIGHYSWAAATATDTSVSASGEVATSICPKNWDLPSRTQFYNLRSVGSVTSATIAHITPYNFVYGGYRNAASGFYSQTSYGYYWTSSNSSANYGYWNYVYSNGIYNSSTSSGYKYYGAKVRCVASNGTATINYDGNGTIEYPAIGSVASQENVEINSTNTRANGFTRANWAFNNWNTQADGSGIAIAANASITTLSLKPGEATTLYAQWIPQRQIIYNDNCSYNNVGCATNTDTTNTSSWTNAGNSITLGSDTYFTTRTGYAITSWNTARDGSGTSYDISSSYVIPSNLALPDQVTLYAQWSPALIINFNSNGGNGTMTAQQIPENTSKALKNNSFTAPSGNYFIGWMTEESRANNEVVYTNGATYNAPATVTPGDSVTLYAKWGPRYTIVYNGNNATGGSMVSNGTELKHTSINEGNTVNLHAPNYYKANYGFAGWSPSPTATVGGADPIYGPNESIEAPAYDKYGEEINGAKTVTLYAVWLGADASKTMQTFTPADCQNLTQATYNSTTGKITAPAGSVIALRDQRDNNVYAIARLADGHCWMIENLRLDAANTIGNNQYDQTITNESLAQGYSGAFTGLDGSENTNFSDTTNATLNNKYNSTNITGSYPGYRFPRYNNNNINTSLTASHNGTGNSTYYSWYSYGNYYSWAAAMANTAFYGSSDSQLSGTSICPTNWSLPTGGNEYNNYGMLSKSYGGNGRSQNYAFDGDLISKRFRSFPNNYIYSGTFSDSSTEYRGTDGYYWSRTTPNSYQNAFIFLFSSNYVGADTNSTRRFSAASIRCLVEDTYTIQYDGNGATGGSMVNGDDVELRHGELVEGETAISLYPSNYYKTGYGFAGWSTDPDAWVHFTDNDSTNDPIIYGPTETITAPTRIGQTMTLYAVWIPAKQDTNDNPVYLQDFDSVSCNSLTSTTFNSTTGAITVTKNSIVALTDKRDGNVYAVARLADDNCWMIENLRLEAENTVGNNQYDSSSTNESLAQDYGGEFVGLDATENDNFYKNTNATPNNLYNSTVITGSNSNIRFPRYNNNNTNINLSAKYNGNGNKTYYSWYSYGNYYTWAAAIANTNNYSNTSSSESAGTSICPANWTLPTSSSSTKDFGNLSQQYGGTGENQESADAGDVMSNRFRAFPNNFIKAGYINSSNMYNRGTDGYYWSRSVQSNQYVYILYLSSSSLRPSGRDFHTEGFPIRCLVSGS